MALVAEHKDPTTGEREILGVGRLSKVRGTRAKRPSSPLLVSDHFQGHGLGTELLRRLIQVGRDEKLRRLTGEILVENRGMQKVCERLGFTLKFSPEDGTVEVRLALIESCGISSRLGSIPHKVAGHTLLTSSIQRTWRWTSACQSNGKKESLVSQVLELQPRKGRQLPRGVMKANVFREPGKFALEEKPIPTAGPGEAVVQVRLTTICGTDIHIIRGEYPVAPGLTIGHEAVGVIHELGPGVTGYQLGQRVLVGAVTPCGQCEPALSAAIRRSAAAPWAAGNSATLIEVRRPSTSDPACAQAESRRDSRRAVG